MNGHDYNQANCPTRFSRTRGCGVRRRSSVIARRAGIPLRFVRMSVRDVLPLVWDKFQRQRSEDHDHQCLPIDHTVLDAVVLQQPHAADVVARSVRWQRFDGLYQSRRLQSHYLRMADHSRSRVPGDDHHLLSPFLTANTVQRTAG